MQNRKDMITVEAVRKRLQLSREDFARLMGKSTRTIRRWEQDETKLDATVLRALKQLEAEQS